MAGGKTIGIPLRPKKHVIKLLFSILKNKSLKKLKIKYAHLKMMTGK